MRVQGAVEEEGLEDGDGLKVLAVGGVEDGVIDGQCVSALVGTAPENDFAEEDGLSEPEVRTARGQLLRADLIAYEAPLCQVLSLGPAVPRSAARTGSAQGADNPTVD